MNSDVSLHKANLVAVPFGLSGFANRTALKKSPESAAAPSDNMWACSYNMKCILECASESLSHQRDSSPRWCYITPVACCSQSWARGCVRIVVPSQATKEKVPILSR
jgi:hypothetical protein